jgi:hypothetical protein
MPRLPALILARVSADRRIPFFDSEIFRLVSGDLLTPTELPPPGLTLVSRHPDERAALIHSTSNRSSSHRSSAMAKTFTAGIVNRTRYSVSHIDTG